MNSPKSSANRQRILLEALVLAALAVAVGLSLNYRMVLNAFQGKTVSRAVASPVAPAPQPDTQVVPQQFPEPVDLDQIDALVKDGALLIDARNHQDYLEAHLSGARSLPLGELDTLLPEFLNEVPRDRTLIVYCNGFGCPDSFDLGMRLLSDGYQRVQVFEGGFPEWRDAGRPLESGP